MVVMLVAQWNVKWLKEVWTFSSSVSGGFKAKSASVVNETNDKLCLQLTGSLCVF